MRSLLVTLARFPLLAWLAAAAMPTFAAEPAAVDAHYSAHWYAPDRSGEGWMLEVLDDQRALLYWFTYDENGGQRWLTALGQIVGNRIDFPDLVLTTGGRFGPGFDPSLVVRRSIGSARLVFQDCRRGHFQYQAFNQAQTFAIVRLTDTLGLNCAPAAQAVTIGHAGQSGSWFDPSHSGEGYTLQWMPSGQALLIWFSFDGQGHPYWMLGVGAEYDGLIRFPNMHATRGARFGSAFDPAQVERFAWGEVGLDLDCNAGSARYESGLPGFGSGALNLVSLTRLQGLACAIPPPPDPSAATWQQRAGGGPALSELPGAHLGEHVYLAGGLRTLHSNSAEFWRYTPTSNAWTRLADLPARRDHAMLVALGQALYVFGGFATGPIAHDATDSAWRYDVASGQWSVLARMPHGHAAGGAAAIDGQIYVVSDHGHSVDRYDPVNNRWTSLPLTDDAPRDHTAVVAYRGDLWIMGGRDPNSGEPHGRVAVFDPRTGLTRSGPSLGQGRSGFAAAVVGEQIVVTGGEGFNPTPYLVGGALAYSPDTGRWRSIAAPPVLVHGAAGVDVDGRFHLLLGSTLAGGVFNPATVQVLVPNPPR